MLRGRATRPGTLTMILFLGLLVGCASDAVHMAQFKTGMTRAQVEAAQGKPDGVETSGDFTALHYQPSYYVILEKDRVIAFGQGSLKRYPDSDRYFIVQTDP
jgi:hypothetical protein